MKPLTAKDAKKGRKVRKENNESPERISEKVEALTHISACARIYSNAFVAIFFSPR